MFAYHPASFQNGERCQKFGLQLPKVIKIDGVAGCNGVLTLEVLGRTIKPSKMMIHGWEATNL